MRLGRSEDVTAGAGKWRGSGSYLGSSRHDARGVCRAPDVGKWLRARIPRPEKTVCNVGIRLIRGAPIRPFEGGRLECQLSTRRTHLDVEHSSENSYLRATFQPGFFIHNLRNLDNHLLSFETDWNFGYAKLGLATAACNRLCSRIREHNRPEAELQRQGRLDRPRGALCAPMHRTGRDERCISVIHVRPGRGKKGAANINYGATM